MRITEKDATLITREFATSLLNRNSKNRKVKTQNLSLIIDELKRGLFKFNGESIIVGDDGELLDGQHRLLAVEETGIPFKSIVVYDVPNSTFGTIDTGMARTTSDVLSVNDIESYAFKAKLSKMLMLHGSNKNINGRDKSYKITNIEVLEFAIRNDEELSDICSKAQRLYTKSRLLTTSDIGFFWHVFSLENRQLAELFFEELFGGLFSSNTNPCFHLRNKLIESKVNPQKRMLKQEKDKFICKAWRKYCNQEETKMLRVVPGELVEIPRTNLK